MLTIIMNAMQKFNEGLAWLEGYILPETVTINWKEKDITGVFSEAAKRYNSIGNYKSWNEYKEIDII